MMGTSPQTDLQLHAIDKSDELVNLGDRSVQEMSTGNKLVSIPQVACRNLDIAKQDELTVYLDPQGRGLFLEVDDGEE